VAKEAVMEFVSRQVIMSLAVFALLVGLVAFVDRAPSEGPAAPTTQAPVPAPTPAPVPPSEPAQTIAISGILALAGGYDYDGTTGLNSTSCWGVGGYSDIREGLQVVVRDSSSRILATDSLAFDNAEFACVLKWRTQNVAKSDFYSIEIGRRGELVYSHAELESLRFFVIARLGF
jgi:hypothetical protein